MVVLIDESALDDVFYTLTSNRLLNMLNVTFYELEMRSML